MILGHLIGAGHQCLDGRTASFVLPDAADEEPMTSPLSALAAPSAKTHGRTGMPQLRGSS
jgi:hypothetical protein